MIKQITIENYKSIKKIKFSIEQKQDVLCLIGKNGSGKSNIFKAIKYLFNNIGKSYSDEQIIDTNNPYIQKCNISIVFDLWLLRVKSDKNTELKRKFDLLEHYIHENIDIDYNWQYSSKKELTLSMAQFKDGSINWNINNKEIREIIKSFFPIYFIDTRQLDIFNWKYLWKIIGDLSSTVPRIEQEECKNLIDSTFYEIYGDKYESSKNIIEKIFQNNNITLDAYHFNSKYKNAFAMRFGGEQFLVDKQQLDFFSDGTNSYNYLKLLVSLIPQISEISCKFPTILLDEPEIGLHSEYIEELIGTLLSNKNENSLIMISTHSPKIILEIVNQNKNFQLYKVNRFNDYSFINKMNTYWLLNNTNKISIKETDCYFYDYLVYVEGDTEIELFTCKEIRRLFPKMKKIHFYSFDGNEQKLNSINSQKLNLGSEYKLLIDSDKVIKYRKSKNNFIVYKNLKNIIGTGFIERLQYRFVNNNKTNLLSLLEKIKSYENLTYNVKSNENHISEKKFDDLMFFIKEFCSSYNIIINWTTIEGELITYENIEKFIVFLDKEQLCKAMIERHNSVLTIDDFKEKTIHILSEFNGKTETGEKELEKKVTGKTSGWVSKWISFYFNNYINAINSEENKRKQFKSDFPGLYSTLQELENMVK